MSVITAKSDRRTSWGRLPTKRMFRAEPSVRLIFKTGLRWLIVPTEFVERILESMQGSRIRNHNTNIRRANARDASAPAEPVKRATHEAAGKAPKDGRKDFKKGAKSPRKKAAKTQK